MQKATLQDGGDFLQSEMDWGYKHRKQNGLEKQHLNHENSEI